MDPDKQINHTEAKDIFADYRQRTRIRFDAILSALLLPFVIYSFSQSNHFYTFLLSLLFLETLANVISYLYKRIYICSTLLTFGTGLVLLVYGITHFNVHISYWAYPFVVVNYFYTPPGISKYSIPFIVTVLIITAFQSIEPIVLAFRFSASLLLLCLFTSNIIRVINKQQKKLTVLAIQDDLTGAFNRNYMQNALEAVSERAQRGYGTASLVCLDIDHFKPINDQYGHDVGDKILIEVVQLIKSRLRKIDEIFRSGGEEFIVLLGDTAQQGALTFANDLRKQIEKNHFHKDIKVTASMGVVEYQKGLTIKEWIKMADELLYVAKGSGRNCVMPDASKNNETT